MSPKAMSRKHNGVLSQPILFNDFFKTWGEWFNEPKWTRALTVPAVNITEDEKSYKLTVAAPGLKKDDFNVDITGNLLTISAEKEESSEEKDEKYSCREYNYSSFNRTFTLPDEVSQDSIEAEYKDGVLNLTLPKNGTVKKAGKAIKIK